MDPLQKIQIRNMNWFFIRLSAVVFEVRVSDGGEGGGYFKKIIEQATNFLWKITTYLTFKSCAHTIRTINSTAEKLEIESFFCETKTAKIISFTIVKTFKYCDQKLHLCHSCISIDKPRKNSTQKKERFEERKFRILHLKFYKRL